MEIKKAYVMTVLLVASDQIDMIPLANVYFWLSICEKIAFQVDPHIKKILFQVVIWYFVHFQNFISKYNQPFCSTFQNGITLSSRNKQTPKIVKL